MSNPVDRVAAISKVCRQKEKEAERMSQANEPVNIVDGSYFKKLEAELQLACRTALEHEKE